jgi:hypothetical protein
MEGDLRLPKLGRFVAILAAAVVRGQFMPKSISGHRISISTARQCRHTPIFGRRKYRLLFAGPLFNPSLPSARQVGTYSVLGTVGTVDSFRVLIPTVYGES